MGKKKGRLSVGQSTDISTANAGVSILSTLTAPSKAIDQSLASLFGSSVSKFITIITLTTMTSVECDSLILVILGVL